MVLPQPRHIFHFILSVYLRVYMHIYAYIHIYTPTHMDTYIYIYTPTHTHTHIYINMCVGACIHVCRGQKKVSDSSELELLLVYYSRLGSLAQTIAQQMFLIAEPSL